MSYEHAPGMQSEPAGVEVVKPSSVALAEKLMYGGAVVTLLGGLMSLFGDRQEMADTIRAELERQGMDASSSTVDAAVTTGIVTGVLFAVVGAAIWALMGRLNGKGVGWARIVATILGVIGVALTIFGLAGSAMVPGAASGNVLSTILSILTGLIALAVVVLLWRKDSSQFFAGHAR